MTFEDYRGFYLKLRKDYKDEDLPILGYKFSPKGIHETVIPIDLLRKMAGDTRIPVIDS